MLSDLQIPERQAPLRECLKTNLDSILETQFKGFPNISTPFKDNVQKINTSYINEREQTSFSLRAEYELSNNHKKKFAQFLMTDILSYKFSISDQSAKEDAFKQYFFGLKKNSGGLIGFDTNFENREPSAHAVAVYWIDDETGLFYDQNLPFGTFSIKKEDFSDFSENYAKRYCAKKYLRLKFFTFPQNLSLCGEEETPKIFSFFPSEEEANLPLYSEEEMEPPHVFHVGTNENASVNLRVYHTPKTKIEEVQS